MPMPDDWYSGSECAVHNDEIFDTECKYCQAEMQSRASQLMGKRDKFQERAQRMLREGVALAPEFVFQTRFDMLLEMVMNPRQRSRFEAAFIDRLHDILTQGEKDARRARIMQGVPNRMPTDPFPLK